MNVKSEIIAGILTISSTFVFSDFFIELVIGIVVYSTSRIVYNLYGEKLTRIINSFKSKFKKK
jgi:hypothetical protein